MNTQEVIEKISETIDLSGQVLSPSEKKEMTKILNEFRGEAYGQGVTAGKLEALKYTLEERERLRSLFT